MIKGTVFLLLLPALAGLGAASPDFCRGLDCPTFKLLDVFDRNMELRAYEPSTWATVHVDSEHSYETATSRGFQRLFKYFFGDNERDEQVQMTVPVVTAVDLDKDYKFRDDFTVSFFLPYRYQKAGKTTTEEGDELDRRSHRHRRRRTPEAPLPRDDRVKLEDFDGFDAYVKSFGSYAFGYRLRRLVRDFFEDLEQAGCKDFDRSTVLVAVYDPPFRLVGRHNELWVIRKKKSSDDTA